MRLSSRTVAAFVAAGLSGAVIIVYSLWYPPAPIFNPADPQMMPTTATTPCVAPPLLAHSVAPKTTLTYRVLGNTTAVMDDAEQCLHRAFAVWNTVLDEQDIQFVPVSDASRPTNLVVYFGPLPVGTGGAITDVTRDALGYLSGTGILVNTNQDTVSSCLGYYKVGLHEIGHVLGLGHPFATLESSVMNSMNGVNDVHKNIPLVPTDCDVAQVWRASAHPRVAGSQ